MQIPTRPSWYQEWRYSQWKQALSHNLYFLNAGLSNKGALGYTLNNFLSVLDECVITTQNSWKLLFFFCNLSKQWFHTIYSASKNSNSHWWELITFGDWRLISSGKKKKKEGTMESEIGTEVSLKKTILRLELWVLTSIMGKEFKVVPKRSK